MALLKETQDRIANDAKEKFPIPVVFADQPGCMNKREGYIAGATAEATLTQRIADALEMTIKHAKECEELYNISGDAVIESAEAALRQFKDGKGKEVGNDA